MRFDQTGEVLGYVERFHEDIGQAYAELGAKVEKRRVRMLLDYMSSREQSRAEAVRTFAHRSLDPSLKEWDPFTIDDAAIRKRLKERLHPEATPDELLGLGLEVAEWFEKLFLRLEQKSGTPEQKALFVSLRQGAEQEKHKLARNANMLGDF
jgi:hypothetical protein